MLTDQIATASSKNADYEPDYSIVGTGECYESMTPEEEAAMDAEDYRRAMEVLGEIEAGGRTYTAAEIRAKHVDRYESLMESISQISFKLKPGALDLFFAEDENDEQ